jgi:ATP-dependent RNA helicase DDX35
MSFWKPGQSAPGLSYNSNQTGHQAKFDNFRGGADVRIASLAKYKQHFAFLVEKYQTVIVCGESLELKASYLPKYLIEYGWCGQGHRLAFVTAASREARQLHEHCQDSVASGDESFKEKIRLSVAIDDYVPKYTSLIFTTYEALLSQILLDPLLSKYSVLFLDGSSGGFDSSGFNSGLVMSILKKIMRKRVDLRVVIFTSAGDAESLQSFFNVNKVSFLSKDEDPVKLADSCIVFSIESRQYPVQRLFLSEPCSDYITKTIETVFKIHQYEGAGDILVFLSGREDIDTVVTLLSDRVVE